MHLQQISSNVYYFKSPVNVGYIREKDTGLLIDAGLDRSAMNKILRQLDERALPITHLFITHAHADHFGGAHHLQKKREVITIAPEFEEAILRYPKLEPLYLFHGVNPPEEMRNKFLEAKPIRIDHVVKEGDYKWGEITVKCIAFPGHSEYQLGVLAHDILFAGDAYMGVEVLEKHRIPYLTDYHALMNSLTKLMTVSAKGAIPGHGEYEENFKQTVEENRVFYNNLLNKIDTFLNQNGSLDCSLEDAVASISKEWAIHITNIGTWSLFRTAITALIKGLCQENKKELIIKDHKLYVANIE